MDLITWNESIAIDINKINNQHKQLVEIINNLFEAMKDAKGYEILRLCSLSF